MASVATNIVQNVIGNSLRKIAHLTHVLFAAHGVNHGAGAEEQQRLEEGVGDQVEDPRREAPTPRAGTCSRAGETVE